LLEFSAIAYSRNEKPMRLIPIATVAAAALAAALAGLPASAAPAGTEYRDEIRRTIHLSPGAEIRAAGIAGPVSIETFDGGGEAEIHVVRTARSQAELDCYRTAVESSASRISIEHVQFSKQLGCDSINASQQVRLRVPRGVDVHLSTIAGRVDIGRVDGLVRLDSIAGPVALSGVSAARLDALAGGLSLADARPGARGIHVSSVVGPVELAFARNADADVRLTSVIGNVESQSPRGQFKGEGSDFHLRVGRGGPDVSVSSVMGPVRLRAE
jgi:hypothetical protein